jgi:hypothetical protein
MRTTSFPIGSILPRLTSEARAALLAADIIIAVDQRSQREFTVFGMPPLESTTSLKSLSVMQVVKVTLECDNPHLEQLTALVRSVKLLEQSTLEGHVAPPPAGTAT